jgi:hypothetical protein
MRDYISVNNEFLVKESRTLDLLIIMTNLFIDYRNQVWGSIVNPNTGEIPDTEDQSWLKELDDQIDEVQKYLEE